MVIIPPCIGEFIDEARSQKIRDMFVSHQGKETIAVEIPVRTLDEADYEQVFNQFSTELHGRIEIPEFTNKMQNDFSTTKRQHQIASQINLMASLQEFFEYEVIDFGCGLRAVEMYGEESAWDKLNQKLANIRAILEPIKDDIHISDKWWDDVSNVFHNLALTRKDPSNPKVHKFWSEIITKTKDWEHKPGEFYGMGPRTHRVKAYDGWLIKFLTGQDVIKVKHIQQHAEELSGLNQVPCKVSMTWCNPPISEQVQLTAGVMGFQFHKGECTSNGVPSLQPVHMWAMMIASDSKLPRSAGQVQKIVDAAISEDGSVEAD